MKPKLLILAIVVSLAIGLTVFATSIYMNFHEASPKNEDYSVRTKYCTEEGKCKVGNPSNYCMHWLLGAISCTLPSSE